MARWILAALLLMLVGAGLWSRLTENQAESPREISQAQASQLLPESPRVEHQAVQHDRDPLSIRDPAARAATARILETSELPCAFLPLEIVSGSGHDRIAALSDGEGRLHFSLAEPHSEIAIFAAGRRLGILTLQSEEADTLDYGVLRLERGYFVHLEVVPYAAEPMPWIQVQLYELPSSASGATATLWGTARSSPFADTQHVWIRVDGAQAVRAYLNGSNLDLWWPEAIQPPRSGTTVYERIQLSTLCKILGVVEQLPGTSGSGFRIVIDRGVGESTASTTTGAGGTFEWYVLLGASVAFHVDTVSGGIALLGSENRQRSFAVNALTRLLLFPEAELVGVGPEAGVHGQAFSIQLDSSPTYAARHWPEGWAPVARAQLQKSTELRLIYASGKQCRVPCRDLQWSPDGIAWIRNEACPSLSIECSWALSPSFPVQLGLSRLAADGSSISIQKSEPLEGVLSTRFTDLEPGEYSLWASTAGWKQLIVAGLRLSDRDLQVPIVLPAVPASVEGIVADWEVLPASVRPIDVEIEHSWAEIQDGKFSIRLTPSNVPHAQLRLANGLTQWCSARIANSKLVLDWQADGIKVIKLPIEPIAAGSCYAMIRQHLGAELRVRVRDGEHLVWLVRPEQVIEGTLWEERVGSPIFRGWMALEAGQVWSSPDHGGHFVDVVLGSAAPATTVYIMPPSQLGTATRQWVWQGSGPSSAAIWLPSDAAGVVGVDQDGRELRAIWSPDRRRVSFH